MLAHSHEGLVQNVKMNSRVETPPNGGLWKLFSFLTPSCVLRVSYKDCKHQLARAIQCTRGFEDGILLETLEKGVWYPIVHCASFAIRDVMSGYEVMKPNSLGKDYILQQGIYEELRSIKPQTIGKPMDDDHHLFQHGGRAFILVGFKGLKWSLQEVLEDTWKDWTGARYLYLHLPEELNLQQITLYQRQAPKNNIDLFDYILLVECMSCSRKSQQVLTDFVQRYRAQRCQGYLSVYLEASGSSSRDSSSGISSIDVSSDDSSGRSHTPFDFWTK